MDTSQEYVRMCECAFEIRTGWKPTGGDWYLHDYRGSTGTSREFEKQIWGDSDTIWQNIEILSYRPGECPDVAVSTDGKESRIVSMADLTRERCIWLPRQDQLQEMVGKPIQALNGAFYEWLFDSTADGWHVDHRHLSFTSMEQLWLAFVMHEKYQKSWVLDHWEKIK